MLSLSRTNFRPENRHLPNLRSSELGCSHPSVGGGKRALDLVVSFLALVLLSPLLLITALVVLLVIGWPVFFTQKRCGLGGQPFFVIKLRSMSDKRGANDLLLPDSERLGVIGRFLRSTSLDELPELVNVVRGEMSLVGPRPLMFEYVPLYSAEQFRRHEVRPGLTGLAQINGRNALSWADKFALDVQYVDQWSMMLDFKILAATAWQVLTRRGISHEDHATAPRFEGNERDG
jgi:sugar transferase EpsL